MVSRFLFQASRAVDDKKMRLKFLFFPIMLVITFSIFIGYIWPEINNIKDINREKLSNTQALQAVRDKQSSIKSIGTQILNSSSAEVINNYLPNKKVEERVIGGVNYLATDSGISLVSISLKSSNATNSALGALPPVDSTVGGQAPYINDEPSFIEAAISISGDYEKIKLFLDQLQKMTLFNELKSLSISNSKSSSDNSNSSSLSADIAINFGYLPPVKPDDNKIARLKTDLGSETIEALKQYITPKAESIASTINAAGTKGRTNPFLP
jgi:hypothetical protein